MVNQTTVQDATKVRTGSAKIEARPYGGSTWHDLGAIEGLRYREVLDYGEINSDNAGNITGLVKDHYGEISFSMLEFNLHHITILRGGTGVSGDTTGLDNYTETAGTPATNLACICQLLATPGDRGPILNASTLQPVYGITTIDFVKNVAEDTTYTAEADYLPFTDADGVMWIVRNTAGDITSGQLLHVQVDYTPPASKAITTGGRTTINPIEVRLTNTNAAGKNHVAQFYKVRLTSGIDQPYNPDKEAKANGVAIALRAILDTSRSVGDQLKAVSVAE